MTLTIKFVIGSTTHAEPSTISVFVSQGDPACTDDQDGGDDDGDDDDDDDDGYDDDDDINQGGLFSIQEDIQSISIYISRVTPYILGFQIHLKFFFLNDILS